MKTRSPFCIALVIALIGTAQAQISFTANSSLLTGNYGSPGCVVDMNGDHLDDVVRLDNTQLTIDYQQSDGSFVHQSILNTNSSGLWSICAGDLNQDGFNDICLGDGQHVEFIYSANGGASYTSDLIADYIFSQRSTMSDINNDGWLDAFVCHDVDQSHPYRNDGTGVLAEDQSLIQTAAVGGNYAAIWCDYDNDNDQDLYITKCRSGAPVGDAQRINGLYRNDGGTFTEVGAAANMDDGAQSWSTVFEDFDNDGDFDAFIVNHSDQNRFMINNGNGTFTDIIASTGIDANDLGAWESQGADFDNDGYVDIFSEVGGGIYRNNGNLTFTNINIAPDEGGIGDLNNDGWLDYQIAGTIYLNDGGSNHWIKIELEGIISANNGIGSRIEIFGPWGRQIREMRSGQGFSHMNSLQVHFGIGQATAIDSMMIHWPSGVVTTIANPGIDQLHVVPEAACVIAPIAIAANGGTSFCDGDSTQLNAPTGFSSYTWSNGEVGPSIFVTIGGNYTCAAYDVNGCVALSNALGITVVIDPEPTVLLSSPAEFCDGETITLTSSAAQAYVWSNNETTQSIVVGQSGTFAVTTTGQCGQTPSMPVSVTALAAAADPVTNNVQIPVPGTADLNATGTDILWYDALGATSSVGSGNMWTTPFLNSNTTYWCEANMLHSGLIDQGGKLDNSGGGGLPSSGGYSLFDAYEPFTLLTATVYVTQPGSRTVELVDAAGVVLATNQFTLNNIGTAVLTLNYDVPVGTGLSLRCIENDLFRNSGALNYPYAIGNVGSLTTSSNGSIYYYYFYNWQIQEEAFSCPSARVPVDVTVLSTGVNDLDAADAVSIYPIPTDELLHIKLPSGHTFTNVQLVDGTGRIVNSGAIAAGAETQLVDVSSLASGAYSLRLFGNGVDLVRYISIVH